MLYCCSHLHYFQSRPGYDINGRTAMLMAQASEQLKGQSISSRRLVLSRHNYTLAAERQQERPRTHDSPRVDQVERW